MRATAAIALAALMATAASAADGLGRLFTTPAERAELDRLRAEAAAPRPLVEPPPAVVEAPAPPPPAASVRVDGLVLPHGRPATAWVNGQAVTPGSDGVQVDRVRQRVRLNPDPQAPAVELAPGQRYDPVTGQVSDAAAP